MPVIYVQHCDEPGGQLEEGTERWRMHPRIAPLDGSPVVKRQTPDPFLETTLRGESESRDVGSPMLVEIQTEYWVDTTCQPAFSLGYDVTLVEDGHGTWENDLSAAQRIVYHDAVLGCWLATAVSANEVRLGEPARG